MSHGILKQSLLVSLLLVLTLGCVVFIRPARAAAASAVATTYCLHQNAGSSAAQSACEQGYDNKSKSVADACNGYNGNNLSNAQTNILTACQSGWGKANGEDPAVYCSGSSCDLIAKYINPAIDLFSLSFGLIAVISIIFGGIQYSASQGDPQKTAAAKSRISNTMLAIFIYLFLYSFLQFLIPGGIFH